MPEVENTGVPFSNAVLSSGSKAGLLGKVVLLGVRANKRMQPTALSRALLRVFRFLGDVFFGFVRRFSRAAADARSVGRVYSN